MLSASPEEEKIRMETALAFQLNKFTATWDQITEEMTALGLGEWLNARLLMVETAGVEPASVKVI